LKKPALFKSACTALALSGALALTGCSPTTVSSAAPPAATTTYAEDAASPTINGSAAPEAAADASSVTAMLEDNKDFTKLAELTGQAWDPAEETSITLAGDSLSAGGSNVQISGNIATITAPGTYRVSGTLANGGLVVDTEAEGTVRLVLENADITNRTGAAIAILNADATDIVLADGTQNFLSDGATYADTSDDAPNSTLWSSDDLTISGTGSLDITGLANDGINARDGLVIDAASLTINAVDDGIRGKDYLVVLGGRIDVTAQDDGLKSDAVRTADEADKPMVGYIAILGGDVTVTAGDDAITAEAEVIIADGNVTVTQSYEGIEAAQILIAGGNTTVVSSDDGVNAASDVYSGLAVYITGGDLTITANGDGIDSNGTIRQTGGNVLVNGPTARMDSSIDANGTISIDGGTMLAVGSAGMLTSPSADSAQGWLATPLSQVAPAGSEIQIRDANGNVVASYTLLRDAEAVTFSDASVQQGATYTIDANGTQTSVVAGQATGRGGGRNRMGGGPGGAGGPGAGDPGMGNPGGGRRNRSNG